jgi:hypothetical protein
MLAFRKNYFAKDFEVIQKLGSARSREDFYQTVVQLHKENETCEKSRKINWKLRLSGRKLLALESKVLKKAHFLTVQEQMERSFT